MTVKTNAHNNKMSNDNHTKNPGTDEFSEVGVDCIYIHARPLIQ